MSFRHLVGCSLATLLSIPGNSSSMLHLQQQYLSPSLNIHSLRHALLAAEEDNLKLSSKNTNLRHQVATLQRTFGRELHVAQQNIDDLEKALEATKSDQNECKKREETL